MKKRVLSGEERDLWKRATRDVSRFREAPAMPGATPDSVVSPPVRGPLAPPPAPIAPLKKRTITDPFSAGDPKIDRRAGRERMPVEAVLDLHGHTQNSAEPALRQFCLLYTSDAADE